MCVCVCLVCMFMCGKGGERIEGKGVVVMTLEKEMDEILRMEEEGSGFGKEQLRSFCC